MRRALICLCLWAGPLMAQPAAPVLEAYIDGNVLAEDIRVEAAEMAPDNPVRWTGAIELSDADYIRLHLRIDGAGFGPEAFLRVAAPLGQDIDIPLAGIGETGHWTGLLPFGRARLALVSDTAPPPGTVFAIDQIIRQTSKGTPFSTWGEANEMKPINDPSVPAMISDMRAPVAFLSFIDDGFARSCTGFLIGPQRMITNQHCINSAENCQSMAAVFGYEFGPDQRLKMGPQVGCAGFDEGATNFELDVSVVTLDRAPGDDFGQIDPVTPGDDLSGALFVIQHPGSSPKQVSFIKCDVAAPVVEGRAPETDFTHTCDTAGGSSGSPVFNADGVWVGVHHFGFADSDGAVWTENRGVHAHLIMDWIATLP